METGNIVQKDFVLSGSLGAETQTIGGQLSSDNGRMGGTLSATEGLGGALSFLGKPGLSAYQIAVKYGYEGTEEEWVQSLKKFSLAGTKEYWEENSTLVPERGQFVVITNYKTKEENGELILVPGIKVGNGIDSVDRLPIISGSADKLEHTITIGEHVFDGTSDVIVEVYNGEIINDEFLQATTFMMLETPIELHQMDIVKKDVIERNMGDSIIEMSLLEETKQKELTYFTMNSIMEMKREE